MADKAEAEQAERTLHGVTLVDFNRWKHNPVTKLFRRYLSDKHADAVQGTMEAWLAGDLELAVENEARGMLNAYQAMARLLGPDDRDGGTRFGEIAAFYEQTATIKADEDETEDAAETDQPPAA